MAKAVYDYGKGKQKAVNYMNKLCWNDVTNLCSIHVFRPIYMSRKIACLIVKYIKCFPDCFFLGGRAVESPSAETNYYSRIC